ncbi:MAG: DEAD/DEAH box helicase family protein [Ignavibacteria bacterium]|jgi:type III restriction enzyme|nr:DEAD/DEAH box helicase family protein [Ignavibacteria bacterium]
MGKILEKEFLYATFDNKIADKMISNIELPPCIMDNLRHTLRPYQMKAFQRFIYYSTEYDERTNPAHLLYNMATGSGKTLIMAGLMLYLYQQGYRNFLFFVNATNIIEKTKVNFIDSASDKYLFSERIVIDGREIKIREANGYWNDSDDYAINIKFSTIQQLHQDLENVKENGITIEDIAGMKIVLLADEAHHLNADTKNGQQAFASWENTIESVKEANKDNIILEFTATTDYNTKEIANKYRDKVIYRYDLKEYREDKYSKEINLFRFQGELEDRMLYAVLFNIYRGKVAADYLRSNFKPVILFKSKIIKDSDTNYKIFRKLIDNLTEERVEQLLNMQVTDLEDANTNIGSEIRNYMNNKNLSTRELITEMQHSFTHNNCIAVDSNKKNNYAKYMNTLEDAANNPIRAIFAVDMLSEGWDVLNLFDIVRLYETRDSGHNKVGKGTTSEAQLIGRGARYYPFITDDSDDKYRRKYDNEPEHPLKIIETLYYHTLNDSRYVSEIKQALVKEGLIDEYTKEMRMKDSFKETDLYKKGKVYTNKQVYTGNGEIIEKNTLPIDYLLPTYNAVVSKAIENDILSKEQVYTSSGSKSVKLSDIPAHIIRYAISKHKNFTFDKLKDRYKDINSISDFINKYLINREIVFKGNINKISNEHKMLAVYKLLGGMYLEHNSQPKYTGSREFFAADFGKVFLATKKYGLSKAEFANYTRSRINHKPDWYVYEEHYATSEEIEFVNFFESHYNEIAIKYEEIYLVRNEQVIKIYNFDDGRGFEPDFLLFCKEKDGEHQIFQVFIEPKGNNILQFDKWKEEFLSQIDYSDARTKYYITGVPKFYNKNKEKEFSDDLVQKLNV